MKKYDITISTILMVVAAGLFTASSRAPGSGRGDRRRHVAPVFCGIAVLLSALLMVQAHYGPLLPGRAL